MFDSVLAHFVRQLGSARFSVDRSTLLVRFAGRPAVRVPLSVAEAEAAANGARALAEAIALVLPTAPALPSVPGASVSVLDAALPPTPIVQSKQNGSKSKSSSKK
jgi:hypothetical protein